MHIHKEWRKNFEWNGNYRISARQLGDKITGYFFCLLSLYFIGINYVFFPTYCKILYLEIVRISIHLALLLAKQWMLLIFCINKRTHAFKAVIISGSIKSIIFQLKVEWLFENYSAYQKDIVRPSGLWIKNDKKLLI